MCLKTSMQRMLNCIIVSTLCLPAFYCYGSFEFKRYVHLQEMRFTPFAQLDIDFCHVLTWCKLNCKLSQLLARQPAGLGLQLYCMRSSFCPRSSALPQVESA